MKINPLTTYGLLETRHKIARRAQRERDLAESAAGTLLDFPRECRRAAPTLAPIIPFPGQPSFVPAAREAV